MARMQVALAQHLAGFRAAGDARHAQHLARLGILGLDLAQPGLRQAQASGFGQRARIQLHIQRMQGRAAAHMVEHLGDQLDGHAAIGLRDAARAFHREAGPQRLDGAVLVDQHAIELVRRIQQLDSFEVGVAELHAA